MFPLCACVYVPREPANCHGWRMNIGLGVLRFSEILGISGVPSIKCPRLDLMFWVSRDVLLLFRLREDH